MVYAVPRYEMFAWLVNITTDNRIEIPLLAEEISEEDSANFSEQDVIGRSTPFAAYSQGGARSVSIDLPLHSDLLSGSIVDMVQDIKALVYPEYEEYVVSPEVMLRVGDFLAIRGYCDSVSVNWMKPMGDDEEGNSTYWRADVSLSINETKEMPDGVNDVEGGSHLSFS